MACRCRGCIGSASPPAGSSVCCLPRHIPTGSPAWCCAIRRRAFPTTSSAPTRWTMPPRRTRCAPLVSVHGAARPSATGSTAPTPVRRCATGWCARWTARGRTSPPRCTIASRASTSTRYCRASSRRSCCSAATTARLPRRSRRCSPRPCQTAGSNCLPATGTASTCCSRNAAPARP